MEQRVCFTNYLILFLSPTLYYTDLHTPYVVYSYICEHYIL